MTDDEAIRRIIAQQVDGWNRGDARAWVAGSDDDLRFTNIVGMRWDTREGSEQRHALMFRGPFAGSHLEVIIESLQALGADTAVAELLTTLTNVRALPPGIAADADGALRTRMLQVFVKRDAGWRIAACHNTAVRPDIRGGATGTFGSRGE